MRKRITVISIVFALCIAVFADVRIEFPGTFVGPGSINGPEPYMYNTTLLKIDLAGWRFLTPNYRWTGLDGDPGATVTNVANGEIETRLKSQSARTLPYTGNTPLTLAQHGLRYAAATLGANDDGTPYGTYILWKTGSSGIPIDPVDEDPITVDQIDSLLLLPDFYNSAYRYLDKIGTNGGTYSGGLLDTYYGQTQIMLPIPPDNFTVNQTSINLDPNETGGPLYWMALSMGQEYFSIDKQLLIATGFKESGIAAAGLPYANSIGVYGPFHVENWTCVARAVAWPHFYPDHAVELGASPNATVFATTYMPANDFCTEYMGAPTPENGASCANAVIVGGLNYWYLYYLLGYSEDICWKNVLEGCPDPYIGIAALAPLYNMGMNSGAESPLHVNSYQALLGNANGSNLFAVGNSNYRIDVVNAIKALEDASQQSLTNTNIQLWDTFITLEDIENFFFGDGGSFTSQGKGGFMRHFDVDRQKVWDDVQAAFTKLSSHWAQSPPAISYRYDFLTLLRVVKGMFDIQRPKPADSESAVWIEQRSKIGGCGVPLDKVFPFMEFGSTDFVGGTFTLELNATDDKYVGDVKWTTDYDWKWWNDGTYISGGAADQDYEVVITNATAGAEVWVSVTDSGGNTIVKKTAVTGPKEPTLDSTIAEDTFGDGEGDKITIFIRPAIGDSADELSEYQNLKYSWPTQTNMIDATTNVTVNTDNLQITDNTLTGGAGLGKVTFDYPSKKGYEDDVLDKVGPAFYKGVAELKAKIAPTDLDTLVVNFTEPIQDNLQDNTIYLNFAPDGQKQSITAVRESATRYRFLFATGSVEGNDSVQIVHTSGIADTLGNIPLSINQYIPIREQTGLFIVNSGKYLDSDANGIMDKIVVTFDTDPSEIITESSFTFEWQDNTGALVNMTVSGSAVTLVGGVDAEWVVTGYSLRQYITSLDGNWGKATLTQPNPSGTGTTTTDITNKMTDGMAPVIFSADYYSYNSATVKDTLLVTFSENMGALNDNQPFKFLEMPGATGYMVDVAEVTTSNTVITFYVSSFTNGIIPETGDSIWINAGHGVKDNINIEQNNDNNKKQPLNVYSAFSIQSVAYFDTDNNPDGYIDKIQVTLSAVPDAFVFDDLALVVTLANNRNFAPLTKSSFTGTTTGFDIAVTQAINYDQVKTDVDAGDTLGISEKVKISADGVILPVLTTVKDSLAPVIARAIFGPAIINESNDDPNVPVPDTLAITFSEKIEAVSTSSSVWPRPFGYKHAGGTTYTMGLSPANNQSATTMTFLVTSKSDYPVVGRTDSIWIDENALFEDLIDLIQGKNTKPIPLIVLKYQPVFRLVAFPNPFGEGEQMQNKIEVWSSADGYDIKNDDGISVPPEDNEIAILIIPYGFVNTAADITAEASIFDPVGNTIQANIPLTYNNKAIKQAWYGVWKAKNSVDRDVGPGTYVCIAEVKESEGANPDTYKVMIGVKRREP